MPRAIACFDKQGIQVTPVAGDYETEGVIQKIFTLKNIIPSIHSLAKWEKLIHEWVGMLTYKLKGYV